MHVEVPAEETSKLSEKQLVSGKLIETLIQMEIRTALTYLFKPIQEQIERAFGER
jgi:HlyD family secretion protein